MDIRKSAVDLTAQERDKFLEAVIRLKNRPAPAGPAGTSVYDQFVALHSAVMAVHPPGHPVGETVNFAHWNIGFCAWHRQYVRQFEKALQTEVPGVTVPYWDWTDHPGAVAKLFTDGFLASLGTGAPADVTDSVLRNPVPPADRPAWWPTSPPGVTGFPVHPLLEEGFGTTLARADSGEQWPPGRAHIAALEQHVVQQPGVHPFWYFWTALEEGFLAQGPGGSAVFVPAHNSGHNFIGGHMSQAFSPNDPAFWLHHANVDRIWANWQNRRLAAVAGSKPRDHYPPPTELSPFNLEPAPPGHRLDDRMWPWVGTTNGYDTLIDAQVKQLLPDFSGMGPVTVADVLDTETLDTEGYRYAPPAP
ncbi:tyrosinase family protein [Streptomyces cinnabarinus]|uniref:Tyrosinase family protein n=1 Tax=Streptomyces cinnabarinus TaxID=67287 RepID=A0ABY7K8H2_9ACTN|nr:tyrosinase family protein [Streptomyces cinnabarinus]WAZ19848.1 tyrosinase family protein [Streptomyces cinnabarinus]